MRISRTLILLALTAIAASAFAAGTASAQELGNTIDIRNDSTGAPCNPCEVRIEGENHIVALPSGVKVSQCRDSLHARFYGINQPPPAGSPARGELEWSGLNDNPPPNCLLANCAAPEHHWNATAIGEFDSEVAHTTIRFCFVAGGASSTATRKSGLPAYQLPTSMCSPLPQFASGAPGESKAHGPQIPPTPNFSIYSGIY